MGRFGSGFRSGFRRLASRRRIAAVLLVAASAVAVLAGGVAAQQSPSTNSGPQFGEWGPGRGAPGGEPQLPSPTGGNLGAAAPGAPAPSPSFGGCSFNLGGSWAASGEETNPTAFLYTGSVNVTQYGRWLQATETQGMAQTQYYGRCNGESVTFDVYSDGQFIGYQNGTVQPGGRFGAQRISFNWSTWAPSTGAGRFADRARLRPGRRGAPGLRVIRAGG